MRSLVILVALSCCSAQLVLPSAPWVLPYANLITNPDAETEVKPVALSTPYFHPFGHHLTTPYLKPLEVDTEVKPLSLSTPYLHPFGHHLVSPYLHPLKTESDVKPVALSTPYLHPFGHHFPTPYGYPFAHHLPYVVAAEEPAAEEETAVETASRRRRDVVSVPLPYFHAVPTVKKATIETKQFELTDAATPADTTKIELTTKEHEISVPAIKYVQPHINLKPVTYTALSPAFSPYHAGVAPGVLPYHAGVAPGVLPYHAGFPAYSTLHPYHYPTLATAPVIKIDEE